MEAWVGVCRNLSQERIKPPQPLLENRDARTRGILVRANVLQMMHLPPTKHLFSEVGFPGPWLLGLLRVKNRKCSIDGDKGATGFKS